MMLLPAHTDQTREFYANSVKTLTREQHVLQNPNLKSQQRYRHLQIFKKTLNAMLVDPQAQSQSTGEYFASKILNDQKNYNPMTVQTVATVIRNFTKDGQALTHPHMERYAQKKGYGFNLVWGQEC